MIQKNKNSDIVYCIICIIFDNKFADCALNYSRSSFSLKKDKLKKYVYVDKLDTCKPGYENYYLNRIYKLMYMESENCAIFYREY